MNDRHLALGLRGMIGAAQVGNGNLAHFGAALLAGWWFRRDHALRGDVAEAMARQADLLVERNRPWDGGVHAFLLDTAVAVDHRHRGIGTRLVREAIAAVRRHREIEWLHVDSDDELMSRFDRRRRVHPFDRRFPRRRTAGRPV